MSDDALSFLRTLSPAFNGGLMQLLAITPESVVTGKCFTPSDEGGLAAFVRQHAPQASLYFGLNAVRHQPEKGKAKENDIGHLLMLGADFDPKSAATREADLAAARERVGKFKLTPTGLIDSGRGLQAVWLLKAGVHVNGNLAELKRYSEALTKYLGADHTFNLDRVFRLPGTTNRLNAKKLKEGYAVAPTRLLEWHPDRCYGLSDFCFVLDAAAPADAENKCRSRAEDRSKDLLAKVHKEMRKGTDHVVIVDKYRKHPHAQDQSNPERAVWRCIEEVLSDLEKDVEDMNRRHAVVWVGGDAVVLWPEKLEDGVPRVSSVNALRTWYANAPNSDLVDCWLRHPRRNQFDRIVFQPGKGTPGEFNLWAGWPLVPQQGDCSRQLAHIREVICAGNDPLYSYVIQWLANIFQSPGTKPGTALVLYSGQGTGKGALYRMLEPLLRPACIQLAGSDLLLGRFNDFFAGKLVTFADEAAWPGDKRGIQKLKSYITEDWITVERKHVPAFSIANHCRFIIATNRDQAAPAEFDDRRFVVLKVSPHRRDDYAYWQALADEQANGGSAALLHHLLHEVPVTMNLRQIPKTEALAEQKLLNLDPEAAWWRWMLLKQSHTLQKGSGASTEYVNVEFGRAVKTESLHEFYLDHCKQMRVMHPVSIDAIGIALKKFCPALSASKREPRVEERRQLNLPGPKERRYVGDIYVLPELEAARRAFEETLRQPVKWPEAQEDSDNEV